MPKVLFKTIDDLRKKCDEYFKVTDLVAPRSFRIYIGVSKQTLSSWKKSNTNYFDLIKSYEDKILAKVEEYAIYGQAHPDIKKALVVFTQYKSYYADKLDKDGKVIHQGTVKVDKVEAHVTGKFNQVGAMMTLRSYDTEQYAPEFRPNTLEAVKEQIVIHTGNTSNKKILGLGVVDGKVKTNESKKKN